MGERVILISLRRIKPVARRKPHLKLSGMQPARFRWVCVHKAYRAYGKTPEEAHELLMRKV